MADDAFEWDKAKAAENYRSHGITFEQATRAFADPFAIERVDNRETYGEDRFNILGMVNGRLLFVAFTLRGETIRIISARGAEPHEKRTYHEDNA